MLAAKSRRAEVSQPTGLSLLFCTTRNEMYNQQPIFRNTFLCLCLYSALCTVHLPTYPRNNSGSAVEQHNTAAPNVGHHAAVVTQRSSGRL